MNTTPTAPDYAGAKQWIEKRIRLADNKLERTPSYDAKAINKYCEESVILDTIRQALALAADPWQPIETCEPFDGLVAYIGFADGFWSLAKYRDFISENRDGTEDRVQFWSLSDYHDPEIYKWYGNHEKPDKWFYIPPVIPAAPAERG